jgi:hypothetical protein
MSTVSGKVEHLIRAAIHGIKAQPDTWNQNWWVKTPKDYGIAEEVPACGTTYCLGGWMMLYDDWSHRHSSKYTNIWIKDGQEIEDPFTDHLSSLIEVYEGQDGLDGTIFAMELDTIEKLVDKIVEDTEINFEEECPCLTEEGLCILAGCPCGKHVFTHQLPEIRLFEGEDNPVMNVITGFVTKAQDAGDRITVRQVLADRIIVEAFTGAYTAGQRGVVDTVTKKAERRIQEVRAELADMTRSRDQVIANNSRLQREAKGLHPEDVEALKKVIRKLQGQVDDLNSGVREVPAFAKLKAKQERAQQHIAALTVNNADLENRLAAVRRELHDQKQVVVKLGGQLTQGRQEGFRRAVQAWQKALDEVKKQEGL